MQLKSPQGKIPPFGLRLQPHMRGWLAARAEANGRSMNSELLAIIKTMMSAEPGAFAFANRAAFTSWMAAKAPRSRFSSTTKTRSSSRAKSSRKPA